MRLTTLEDQLAWRLATIPLEAQRLCRLRSRLRCAVLAKSAWRTRGGGGPLRRLGFDRRRNWCGGGGFVRGIRREAPSAPGQMLLQAAFSVMAGLSGHPRNPGQNREFIHQISRLSATVRRSHGWPGHKPGDDHGGNLGFLTNSLALSEPMSSFPMEPSQPTSTRRPRGAGFLKTSRASLRRGRVDRPLAEKFSIARSKIEYVSFVVRRTTSV